MDENEIKARKISVARFFDQNKSIAGFGNPMRATFTSVRELVENGLDAAERRGVPPRIDLEIKILTDKEINELLDMKKSKTSDKKNLEFLKISCKDNGIGVEGKLIPWLFGRVLTGTKYGAQQTRGTFGLGAKMCLLYAMSTIDLPVEVKSRHHSSDETHEYKLFIDREENEPIIVNHESYREPDPRAFDDAGTEVSVFLVGSWKRAKSYVLEYFKQLAIITPYADFHLSIPGDSPGKQEIIEYLRVIDDVPPVPKTVPVHPWGCDITQFKAEITATKETNLIDFLTKHFMGVSKEAALSFFQVLGIDSNKSPKELTSAEVRRIVHEGFQRSLDEAKRVKRKRDRIFKFDEPRGDALSPLGAHRLRKGIEKELHPDFVESVTRPPKAYGGHPFIIEAAIGYGGGVTSSSSRMAMQDNKIVYRFANRIPLIFGGGNDVIVKTVNMIKWNEYGLTRASDPLAIAVSLVSTKIPFPETSKEYIDQVDEIQEEILLALQQLGRKLRTYLRRTKKRQRERQRTSRFERYAPITINNLLDILRKEGLWIDSEDKPHLRIISGLASGEPRVPRLPYPIGEAIFQSDIWCPETLKQKLQDHNITSVEEFLRIPNPELVSITGRKELEIDRIKRRTIEELDYKGKAPLLDARLLVSEKAEKLVGHSYLSLQKAFSRKWIKTMYDYLVSPPEHLIKITGLTEKLVEDIKLQVLNELTQGIVWDQKFVKELEGRFIEKQASENTTSQEGQVKENPPEKRAVYGFKITEISPSIEQILGQEDIEILKKRNIKTKFEFLHRLSLPKSELNNETLGMPLIKYFKEKIREAISIDPTFATKDLTKLTPDWTDGNTKKALRRANLTKAKEFLEADNKVLYDMRSLRNVLFDHFVYKLKREGNTPLGLAFRSRSKEEADELTTLLRKEKIKTVEEFMLIPITDLAKGKYAKLQRFLLEKSKDIIIEHQRSQKKVYPLQGIKDIPIGYDEFLLAKGIIKTTQYVITPSKELTTNKVPLKKVLELKQAIGTPLSMFSKKIQKELKKEGIITLEEVVYIPQAIIENPAISEETKTEITDFITILHYPVKYVSPLLSNALSKLQNTGITNIGRFLIWDINELVRITKQPRNVIQQVKEEFRVTQVKHNHEEDQNILTVLSTLGYQDMLTYFKKINITSLADVFYHDFSYPVHLTIEPFKTFDAIYDFIFAPFHELGEFIPEKTKQTKAWGKFIDLLRKKNYMNMQDLLLHQEETMALASTKQLKEELQRFFELGRTPLGDTPSMAHITLRTFHLRDLLNKPIAFLKNFEPWEIQLLYDNGIERIGHLVTADLSFLARLFKTTKKSIQERLDTIKIKEETIPLYREDGKNLVPTISFDVEGEFHFYKEELQAFKQAGYKTVEEVFYTTSQDTFNVLGVRWEIVNRFKKLLRSPLVLMNWEKQVKIPVQKPKENEMNEENTDARTHIEEKTENKAQEQQIQQEQDTPLEGQEYQIMKYYESLTPTQMNKLNQKRIYNIIDFLNAENQVLSEVLEWDLAETKQRKESVIIEEIGISLDDLEIFRPEYIKVLENMGITSLEDLYFVTQEETWDIEEIPWEVIQTIKDLLNLPVKYLSPSIDEEFLATIEQAQTPTILSFLLTSNELLEQRTGLPAERFENIKASLDLPALQDAFDKPVYFTPFLSYRQTEALSKSGIKKITHLMLEDHKKIARILNVKPSWIKQQRNNITYNNILKAEEERGISLRETLAFDYNEERIVYKGGFFESNEIDTLQEVYFQLTKETFQGPKELAERIESLKIALDLPLSIVIDDYEVVQRLSTEGIETLRDLLFIYFEHDTFSQATIDFISHHALEYFDLRRFVSLSLIPRKAVFDEDENLTTDNEQSLLGYIKDTYQKQGSVEFPDGITISELFEFLDSKVRFTSLAQHIQPSEEELLDRTIKEFLLEDTDEKTSFSLIKGLLRSRGGVKYSLRLRPIPVTYLPFTIHELHQLMLHGIYSFKDFAKEDIKQLSAIMNLSQKEISMRIQEIRYDQVLEVITKQGFPLDYIEYMSKETLQTLRNENGIEYVDQIICLTNDEIKALPSQVRTEVQNLKIALLGTIGFIGDMNPRKKHELKTQGIHTPILLLKSLQTQELSHIKIAENMNFKALLDNREAYGFYEHDFGMKDMIMESWELPLQFTLQDFIELYYEQASEKPEPQVHEDILRTLVKPVSLMNTSKQTIVNYCEKGITQVHEIFSKQTEIDKGSFILIVEQVKRANQWNLNLLFNKNQVAALLKRNIKSLNQLAVLIKAGYFQRDKNIAQKIKEDVLTIALKPLFLTNASNKESIHELLSKELTVINDIFLISPIYVKENFPSISKILVNQELQMHKEHELTEIHESYQELARGTPQTFTETLFLSLLKVKKEYLYTPIMYATCIPLEQRWFLRQQGITSIPMFLATSDKELSILTNENRKVIREWKAKLFSKPLALNNPLITYLQETEPSDTVLNAYETIQHEDPEFKAYYNILNTPLLKFKITLREKQQRNAYYHLLHEQVLRVIDLAFYDNLTFHETIKQFQAEIASSLVNQENLLHTVFTESVLRKAFNAKEEDYESFFTMILENIHEHDELHAPVHYVIMNDKSLLEQAVKNNILTLFQVYALPVHAVNEVLEGIHEKRLRLDLQQFKENRNLLALPIRESKLSRTLTQRFEEYGVKYVLEIYAYMLKDIETRDITAVFNLLAPYRTSILQLEEPWMWKQDYFIDDQTTVQDVLLRLVVQGNKKEITSVLSQLEKFKDTPSLLGSFPDFSANEVRTLEKYGLKTIEDLIAHVHSHTSDIIPLEPELEQKIQELLTTPILQFQEINANKVSQRFRNETPSIEDIILEYWKNPEDEILQELRDTLMKPLSKATLLSFQEIEPGLAEKLSPLGITYIDEFLLNPQIGELISHNKESIISAFQPFMTSIKRVKQLQASQKNNLLENKIYTIAHLYLMDEQQLSEILRLSGKRTEELKRSLLKESFEPGSIKIQDLAIIPEEDKEVLSRYGITYLEDFLYNDPASIPALVKAKELHETLKKNNIILETPLYKLDGYQSLGIQESKVFRKHGIRTLKEFYHAVITGEFTEKNVIPVIINSKIRTLEPPLDLPLETMTLGKMHGELAQVHLMPNMGILQPIEKAPRVIFEYPLTYFTVPAKHALNMAREGIQKGKDYFTIKAQETSKKLRIPPTIRKRIVEQTIQTIATNKQDYFPIQPSALLPESQVTALKENGYYGYPEVLLSIEDEDLKAIKGVTINSIRNARDLAKSMLWDIQPLLDEYFSTIMALVKKGYLTVNHLLLSRKTEVQSVLKNVMIDAFLTRLYELKPKDFVSGEKTTKPSLSSFPDLKKKDEEALLQAGIRSIRDIYLDPTIQVRIKDEGLLNAVKRVQKRLVIPLTELQVQKSTELKKHGIITWGDFILVSNKLLSEITGLSINKVVKIKKTIPKLGTQKPSKPTTKTNKKQVKTKTKPKTQASTKKPTIQTQLDQEPKPKVETKATKKKTGTVKTKPSTKMSSSQKNLVKTAKAKTATKSKASKAAKPKTTSKQVISSKAKKTPKTKSSLVKSAKKSSSKKKASRRK